MGKQYLVIYLQYDSGCFVRCVWDCVFACRLLEFMFLDGDDHHTPELPYQRSAENVADELISMQPASPQKLNN